MWNLTTVIPPAGVDEAQVRRRLVEKYGIEVAGGIGQLTGKILRIGTWCPLATEENTDFLLEALDVCM